MKTEMAPIADLHEDPSNVRKHDDRNLATIKASLAKWGQQKPIVVGKGNVVIAGNGTLRAARALGWTEIGVVRSGLVGVDAVGYAVADNRTAELAAWDDNALADVLATLQTDEGIDELITGFDAGEIDDLVGSFNVDGAELPDMKSGDREHFQQMTFTLHDGQVESVKAAMAAAKDAGPFDDSQNENSNGNALARIAEAYLGKS